MPTDDPATVRPADAEPVLEGVRPVFRAVAGAVVPELAGADEEELAAVESIVETALARRPPAVRRQLGVFIRLIDLLPVVRWGRRFRHLDPDRRTRVLRWLQASRLFLLRRGFWGLRTLVIMGYYSRPVAYDRVGYNARLRGWLEHPRAGEDARMTTRWKLESDPDGAPPPSWDPT